MHKMKKQNSLHGLTIFRFVAAGYVFLFHCNSRLPLDMPDWMRLVVNNGAIGMSFFFVLSGFVMAWSSRNGIRSDYIKARIMRIYPAYFLMGVLTIPFLVDKDPRGIASGLALFITGTQAWIPQAFSFWNFSGSWSVSTELFFYLVFPIIFPLIMAKPIRSLVIAFAITSATVPITMIFSDKYTFPLYYSVPIYRLAEFICGVAIGVIFFKYNYIFSKKWLFLSLLISIYALLFLSPEHNRGYTQNNLTTVSMTMLLIYVLASSNIVKNKITIIPIYLGKISYSFYLMQLPIMFFFDKYKYMFNGIDNVDMWIYAAIINTAMAMLSYHFVEEKFSIKRR